METLVASKPQSMVIHLRSQEEREQLLLLFEQIAAGEGWQPGDQLRTYHDRAHYFAVQVGTAVAGGLQLVLPNQAGHLPYRKVWPDVEIEGQVAHITILALRPEFRGHLRLFWPLGVELWRFCVREGIDRLILEATPSMRARYCRLGFPLQEIGELRMHWGEPCYLCQMDLRLVAGELLMRALKSPIYRPMIVQAICSFKDSSCTSKSALP